MYILLVIETTQQIKVVYITTLSVILCLERKLFLYNHRIDKK